MQPTGGREFDERYILQESSLASVARHKNLITLLAATALSRGVITEHNHTLTHPRLLLNHLINTRSTDVLFSYPVRPTDVTRPVVDTTRTGPGACNKRFVLR